MRALRLLLWPAGAALGVAAESAAFGWSDPGGWLPDLVTGWTLIACGLVGWAWRPTSRSGALMAATGFAWFAANLAPDLLYLHRGPLLQLVLTFPAGIRGRLDRAAVAAAYAAAVVPGVWGSEPATVALASLAVLAAAAGHARAIGRERRERLAALRATAFLAVALAATAVVRLAFPTQQAGDATLFAYEVALCVLAAGLLTALIREPWARSRVADLVVDLGDARPGTLRDALAGALGDPTLEIGYRLGDGYVDAEGRAFALSSAGSARGVTPVERDGHVIAVLVHDPAVLDDPALSQALTAAAGLAASNARLQREVRGRLADVTASRRRLVRAGDEERRRLERRLHDTVVLRLTELGRTLDDERLRGIDARLAQTLTELRELAAGLHPGDGALAGLAARSPVPVELELPGTQLPDEVATAAYFVCSEALANAVKHARASRVTISVRVAGAAVQVEVRDDGDGGADLAGGTGLRGLADRVEALGGTLAFESPPGHGTRLLAELPLGE